MALRKKSKLINYHNKTKLHCNYKSKIAGYDWNRWLQNISFFHFMIIFQLNFT